MFGSSQNASSNDFQCLQDFRFLASVSVRDGGGNRKGRRSPSDGFRIGIGLGVITRATNMGDRAALSTVTVGIDYFSTKELTVSELLEVCTVDPVSIKFEFISETGGEEGNMLLSDQPGEESRITSVAERKLNFIGFVVSIQYTVSPEKFQSELSK